VTAETASPTAPETYNWDGKEHGYLPPSGPIAEMPIPYWTGDIDVDPITFEVIRHQIYSVNEEQGLTIVKVSGSPVATFAHDFATSILSPRGEAVYFGPYNQHQVGTIDHNVKWILGNRADNPGIRDGDMFLGNDPWIGANHQSDVVLVCPVFVDDRLVCWIASVMHTYDVGGSTPGSFCPDSETIYDEPLPQPPAKLVEGGVVRRDIEELFLRRSRLPELVALDLRALVASNHVARKRIRELADRYGPETVVHVMERVIGSAEKTLGDRIEQMPDGEWTYQTYIESAGPTDRGVYPLRMRMRKQGRRLLFDNRGTHEQIGCLNTTVGGWRSGIVAAVTPLLGFDLMHATGGVLRCIDFDPVPGTILSADHPGAVSNPQFGVVSATDLAVVCVSRMMAECGDPDIARRAMAGPSSLFPVVTLSGVDRRGRPYGTLVVDPMGGGLGASAVRDGEDTGGQLWDPVSTMPNIEYTEQYFPVLYLYRRTLADSGGPGRYRGGNAGVLAVTPHKIDKVEVNSSASGWAVPTAAGLFGGLPGRTNGARLVPNGLPPADERAALPQRLEDMEVDLVDLPGKQRSLALAVGDVYELWWSAGGGFGDPLEREPSAVARDVRSRMVTPAHARAAYGVAVDEDGTLDETETARLRSRLGSGAEHPAGTLRVPHVDGDVWRCPRCDGPIGSNRSGRYLEETDVERQELLPTQRIGREPRTFVDADIGIALCRCPTCGLTVDTYLVIDDEGMEPTMRIRIDGPGG
jgi:N-methylhydantoinase B